MRSTQVKRERGARTLTPYEKTEKNRNHMLALAKRAETITAGVEQPMWAEIIRPILEAEIAQWEKSLCWTLSGNDFSEARGSALRAKRLLEHVLTFVGQRDTYAAEAQRLTEELSVMRERDAR